MISALAVLMRVKRRRRRLEAITRPWPELTAVLIVVVTPSEMML